MIELFVVFAAVAVLAALYLPGRCKDCSGSTRIRCVNNLRQTGLAFRIWAGDQTTAFPMARSTTNGGTMEFTSGPNSFRHFQVMSNELSTPKVVFCPSETDRDRVVATNFFNFNNSNISFFVGVAANESRPTMILSGDHNITNGISIRNGLLDLITNRPAGWTKEMHNKVGNVVLADGSVQQLSISGLRPIVTNTGLPTNWLQMPVVQ